MPAAATADSWSPVSAVDRTRSAARPGAGRPESQPGQVRSCRGQVEVGVRRG